MGFDYAKALESARRQHAKLAPNAVNVDAWVARSTRRRHIALLRQIIAALLALLVLGVWLVSSLGHPTSVATCEWVTGPAVLRYGVVHVVGFCVGAAFVQRRSTWARMIVAAAWWSSLLAATVGVWTQPGALPVLMPTMAFASAAGLLMLPAEAYEDGSGDFPLRVHRRAIVVMLTLAIADVETLASAAVNHDEPGMLGYALLDGVAAAVMLVGVIGLYRLRGWGLLLTLTANVCVAGAAWSGVLVYDPGFAALLTVTAMLQMMLGVPLLRTLWRGDVPLRRERGAVPWVGRLVIIACVLASVSGVVRFSDPATLAAACAAH